ncbi:10999_t:CDS:10 [Ambispora leptoticha]|uniref:Elongator complex protein 1 n=1 Tax=Ambispora leptoticha TaxID=144679 RepID=A0A9N8YRA0_9GLOM|nr:10999_t:CDS:10 [Ambispora leptoticha]
MKNLITLAKTVVSLEQNVPTSSKCQFKFTINYETKDVWVTTAFSEESSSTELLRISGEIDIITSFTKQHDFFNSEIICLKYLHDVQACLIAFSSGDIVLVREENLEENLEGLELIEVVGTVEPGIKCMEWSPDEELGVIINGNDNVLLMTKDFEVLTEFPVNVENAGEAASVSVGWGRKETQFHGSEGKSAALKKANLSEYTLSEDDDSRPRVSWCGDGSFFTCSIIDPLKERRVIRIYNREGILQNTSEPIDKLEHSLCWRPSGNLITSSQKLPHKHNICFFEKNGLPHGEFALRETKNHKVVELAWNCDSSILAVWLIREETPSQYSSCVQLWYMNNYHWYLKQEILCPPGESICFLCWDAELALQLHYITQKAYYVHNYSWDVLISHTISKKNAATVAVIDGSSILLTPFRYMNIPPPMSGYSIKLNYPAAHLSFSANNHGNDFAVLEANGDISLFEWAGACEKPIRLSTLLGSINTMNKDPTSSLKQIAWINKNTLLGLHSSSIVKINISFDDESGIPSIVSQTRCITSHHILRLYSNVNYDESDMQGSDMENSEPRMIPCSILSAKFHIIFKEQKDELLVEPFTCFPEFCEHISSTRIGKHGEEGVSVIIGLSKNNKLYANNRLLAVDCTSFFIHNDYLVYTTTQHTARFLPLHVNFSEFKVSDNIAHPFDETIRRVERGSKIIIAPYFDVSLVLQMPRGNLETIHPRAFVLAAVRQHLNSLDYRSAFILCRKHKLDFNILYDHAPDTFLGNVKTFVEQVSEVDYLNLFLSSLRNEDVTLTMYPYPSNDKSENGASQKPNDRIDPRQKVNIICDSIREILENLDLKRYIQSILTAYVHKTPPDLEPALKLLVVLKEKDFDYAEDALKFITFLVDTDKLFDVALGMYNFSLVLMVAQQSQRDPREYLPFLSELQTHEKYFQRFKIDDYLKRYEKALNNLYLAGEKHIDRCYEYILEHELYRLGLTLFSNNPEPYKKIMSMYGDYLSSNKKHKEAGLAYLLADKHIDALDSYKNALLWRDAFSIAQQLNYTSQDLYDLAKEFSELLTDKKSYQDAARVLLDYTQELEDAINLLGKSYMWDEATRICYLKNRVDLLETHIKPSVLEGYKHLIEDIEDMKEQLNKQTMRLTELLIDKENEEQLEHIRNDETLENVEIFSDTSSIAVSDFSRYTKSNTRLSVDSSRSGKSAKSRRRDERKRARGKKGSIYEKEYLFDSLRRLKERFYNMQGSISNILHFLITSKYVEKAKNLQMLYSELEEQVQTRIENIEISSPNIMDSKTKTPMTDNLSQVKGSDIGQSSSVDIIKSKATSESWKLEILQ